MGRGFSLRDINKMTEEEAGIYFDKVPGFENLKKQLDEEKSDKPFFLNLPGFFHEIDRFALRDAVMSRLL